MATQKQKNKITVYITLAVLAIGVILLVKKHKKNKEAKEIGEGSNANNNAVGNNTSTTPKPTKCDTNMILKKGMNTAKWNVTREDGSNCNMVQWSQNKINQAYKAKKFNLTEKLEEDGNFGTKTQAAFKKVLGKPQGSWNEILTKVNAALKK